MENLIINVNQKDFDVHYQTDNYNKIIIGDKEFEVELLKKIGDDVYTFLVNQKVYQVEFDFNKDKLYINLNGFGYEIQITDSTQRLLKKFITQASVGKNTGAGIVKAPMPGLVIKIFVEEGMSVVAGDKLLIVEAMKMENVLKATITGKITKIITKEGSAVDKDSTLLVIEPEL